MKRSLQHDLPNPTYFIQESILFDHGGKVIDKAYNCLTELYQGYPIKNNEIENINWDEVIGKFDEATFQAGNYNCITPKEIIENWKLRAVLREKKHFVVGILDSGFNLEKSREYPHVDWRFYPNESAVIDENGHGTAIASIIAELVKDFINQGGKVTIWIIKVCQTDNRAIKLKDATNGLNAAFDLGCDIINLSWTFNNGLPRAMQSLLYDHLKVCETKAQIFMASGNLSNLNSTPTNALIPALWANQILKNSFCVSALDITGQIYKSFCAGNNPKCIIAPGCISVLNRDWKGTSFATPTAIAGYILNGRTDNFIPLQS